MIKFFQIYGNALKRAVFIIGIPIVIIALLESINALGRTLRMPFPCALEATEAFLVVSAYLAVAFVAAEGGHINITIFTKALSAKKKYFLDGMGNLFGAVIFGLWNWGAWIEAANSVKIMELRIGVYFFPIWPFKIFFALGLTFLVLQLIVNALKFILASFGKKYFTDAEKGEVLN